MRWIMKSHIFIVIFIFSNFHLSDATEEPAIGHPIVHTNLGSIRGNTYATLNSTVNVFWSIPFAEPPIGQLRFQHPLPKSTWTTILDGTRRPNACYQLLSMIWTLYIPQSEDCLYLNVFVPPTINLNSNKLLPVMFYLHGGGYAGGTSSIDRYNSSALAILNNVLVVTTNYRLGAFGYLYSASEEAPGNAGLYDQLTALRWVHDNIDSFGGNPNDVTVFGNSAGGFSTGHLILSKLTDGLFHKAILMSGAPLVSAGFRNNLETYEPLIIALGNITGCYNTTSPTTLPEVTSCLKLVPANELNVAQKQTADIVKLHGPVADPDFFITSPDVFAAVAKKNLTVFVGVVENEGGIFAYQGMRIENGSLSNNLLQGFISNLLGNGQTFIRESLNSNQKMAVHYLYTNWKDVNDGQANTRIISDFVSDNIFVCPTIDFADHLSNLGIDVYYYMFNERPSVSIFPEWVGVTHADEIHFVFGHPLDPTQGYTKAEVHSSIRIMKIFGNFAKYGKPSYDEFNSWPKYTSENREYVKLNPGGNYSIEMQPRALHCALWNNLLPLMIDHEDCSASSITA